MLDDYGLELTRPEFYYYLNQTGVYTVEGTNDAEDFNDLKVMFFRIDQHNRKSSVKYFKQAMRKRFLNNQRLLLNFLFLFFLFNNELIV